MIVINATFIHRRLSGIERYTLNLVRELARQVDPGELAILTHPECDFWKDLPSHVQNIRAPGSNRVLSDQLWVPWTLRRLRPALTHFPAFAPPFWCPVASITTIHDGVFWRHPETLSAGGRLYYKPLLSWALRRGRLRNVITNSLSSRHDICHYLGIAPENVHVTHLGVDAVFGHRDQARIEAVREQHGLPARYLLAVGTLEPRKNLGCLLEAFGQLASTCPDLALVLVGRKGWGQELKLPPSLMGRVFMTGAIDDDRLACLYAGATAFVFPSHYEGFGLPLLEAMACGAPCVASSASSLPEIGGDACLYADPDSPEAFALQIERLLREPELARELSRKGMDHSRTFSWAEMARKTLEVYRSVWTNPVEVMGLPIAPLTMDSLVDELHHRVQKSQPTHVVTANVDFFVQAERNEDFARALHGADLIVADGMPVVMASRLLGRPLPERIAGSDLVVRLCADSDSHAFKLYFLGAAEGVADEARSVALERFPGCQIVGTYSPSPDELNDRDKSSGLVDRINASGANILLVALGAPKQELWLAAHREALAPAIRIGVGGSLDFLAGRITRAPRWMQRCGLEWAFRLMQEPRRLWRRYLVDGPHFLRLLWQHVWKG